MSDKLALKLELTFFLDCDDKDKELLKEKLDDFGWLLLQEVNFKKLMNSFPNIIETGYDVKVEDLEKRS